MAGVLLDLIGERYGKLTVLSLDSEKANGKPKWICKCDCGKIKSVAASELRRGNTKSCGCMMRDLGLKRRQFKVPAESMPEYQSWRSIKRRCYDEKATGYENYGGRGILMDIRWLKSFRNFYLDMGPRPGPEYSIDRIDSDGHYIPSNCRWATPEEQSNNKRNCIYFDLDGEKLTLPVIARKLSLNYSRLYWHISRGMGLQEAIEKVRKVPSRTNLQKDQ